MPFPVGLQTVTVNIGPLVDPTGNNLGGTVYFTPEWTLVHAPSGSTVISKTVAVTISSTTGTGSVVLPASDSTGLTRTNFRYLVTFAVSGEAADRTPFYAVLPAAQPTVDLDLLQPVTGPDGSTYRAPASSVPAGGTAGQVLTKATAADYDTTWTTPATGGGGGGGTVADATTTTKGVVQLAGDLAGTAAAPTVPGLAGKANTTHTHSATDISNSTVTGRNVLTAADGPAARAAIGAGTSSLVIGTTAGTAAEGTDPRLSDARTPTAHTHPVAQISDSTTTGRAVVTAADAAAARTAIGAGTSNLVLGTTAGTAKAGDYSPPADAAAATPSLRSLGTGATQAAAGNDARLSDARTPTAHSHPASDLTATGTRDATTFLRGDNTWSVPPSGGGGTPADATTTSKGVVQLAGDLGGTAAAPTVPALGANVAGSYGTVANRLSAISQRTVRPEFNNYKAWNYAPVLASARTAPTGSGQATAAALPVSDGLVINSVSFGIGLAGSGFTAGQNFVALYSPAGALLAQTADLSATITGTGLFTVSLTAPYTVSGASSELVWVAFIINATTLPQIAGVTANNSALNTGYAGRAASNTYTAPPATITPVFTTVFATTYWVAVG